MSRTSSPKGIGNLRRKPRESRRGIRFRAQAGRRNRERLEMGLGRASARCAATLFKTTGTLPERPATGETDFAKRTRQSLGAALHSPRHGRPIRLQNRPASSVSSGRKTCSLLGDHAESSVVSPAAAIQIRRAGLRRFQVRSPGSAAVGPMGTRSFRRWRFQGDAPLRFIGARRRRFRRSF